MADLSINFAGIESPNPFWLASAPLTNMGSWKFSYLFGFTCALGV